MDDEVLIEPGCKVHHEVAKIFYWYFEFECHDKSFFR